MTRAALIVASVIAFGQRHLWLVNGILIAFVTIVLLLTTEAPVVLYKAF